MGVGDTASIYYPLAWTKLNKLAHSFPPGFSPFFLESGEHPPNQDHDPEVKAEWEGLSEDEKVQTVQRERQRAVFRGGLEEKSAHVYNKTWLTLMCLLVCNDIIPREQKPF